MTEKKIKLVYVVNALLPNNRAHGIQIVNTCEAIGASGIDLTLVSPFFFGPKNSLSQHYGISQSFKHHKIWALDVPKFSFRFQLRSASFFFFVDLYILSMFVICLCTKRKLIIYARGEVIFALLPFSFLTALFFETHQIRNYESIYRYALKRVKGIVVITERLKRKFVDEYGIDPFKITVARDSVDIEKFNIVTRDEKIWLNHGIAKDKKIVLYSGSLGVEKGVHTLAAAAHLVSENIQIVFLGGLPAQVSAFKKKYQDLNNISVLGYVDHKLIPKYVCAADILVLPDLSTDTYSNLYTSPMKLFEYMASGRTILASDIPSLREVLTNDSAVFFKSGDAKSLALSIQKSLKNGSEIQRLGLKAKEIVSEFTWMKRGERIVKHIERSFNKT